MDPVETPAVEPEPTTPVEPETPETPPEGESEPTVEDERLKKARSEAKNLRDRAKAAEAELAAIKQSQMTEAEKAEARLKAAEDQVPTLLKRAVAAETGLPPELAGRLVGDSEEELKADADALKALLAPTEGQAPRDWPNAPQGPRGNPKPQSLPDRIAGLEAEGKYAEAGALKAEMALKAAG